MILERPCLTVKTSNRIAGIRTAGSRSLWDPYLDKFIPENRPNAGERLKAPDGTLATADGGTTPKDHEGWMWDPTVPGNEDHDFYVSAASTAIFEVRKVGGLPGWQANSDPYDLLVRRLPAGAGLLLHDGPAYLVHVQVLDRGDELLERSGRQCAGL